MCGGGDRPGCHVEHVGGVGGVGCPVRCEGSEAGEVRHGTMYDSNVWHNLLIHVAPYMTLPMKPTKPV
jgi:hypothetical protein